MSAFRAAVEARDAEAMEHALHPDVVFSSPAVFRPYEGRETVMRVLRAVMVVLADLEYVDEFARSDAEVLRFRAHAGEREVEGVDLLRYDGDGLVTELTVMIRPMQGLAETVSRMGALLSA